MTNIIASKHKKNAYQLFISQDLVIGDVLVRTYGLAEHYAVFVGYQHGVLSVAENQLGFGVRIISLQQFLNEGELIRIREFNGNSNTVLNRINAIWNQNKSYNLLLNNCEHFANEVTTGIASSNQVRNVLGIAAIGLFGLFFAPKLLRAIV